MKKKLKKQPYGLTLRNDVHGTEATVVVRNGRVSVSAIKQACKKLCGIPGCECEGISRHIRHEQPDNNATHNNMGGCD